MMDDVDFREMIESNIEYLWERMTSDDMTMAGILQITSTIKRQISRYTLLYKSIEEFDTDIKSFVLDGLGAKNSIRESYRNQVLPDILVISPNTIKDKHDRLRQSTWDNAVKLWKLVTDRIVVIANILLMADTVQRQVEALGSLGGTAFGHDEHFHPIQSANRKLNKKYPKGKLDQLVQERKKEIAASMKKL